MIFEIDSPVWYAFLAILLGLVQGSTEFLPISSSGHLRLLNPIFGLETNFETIVLVHMASLFAVILYNKTLLIRLVAALNWRKDDKPARRLIAMITLATLATAFVAFPLRKLAIQAPPPLLSLAFLTTAIILLLTIFVKNRDSHSSHLLPSSPVSSKHENTIHQSDAMPIPSLYAALGIGLIQGLAVLPGISRSGVTIALALFFGMRREAAFRFSFLLSIPATIASFLFTVGTLRGADYSFSEYGYIALAMIVTFFVSLLSLSLLKKIIKKNTLWMFSIYLFILACLSYLLNDYVIGFHF